MDEGNEMPIRSGARHPVYELEALGLETGELGDDVVGSVREVMEARTAPLEKAANRGLRAERLEELDGADEGDSNSLGLECLGWGTSLA